MEQDISIGPTSLVAPGTVEINCQGAGAVSMNLDSSGTPSGFAWQIEGTPDNSNWFSVGAVDPTAVGSVFHGSNATLTGQWVIPAGGFQKIRFNLTAIAGGTATVTLNAGVGNAGTYIAGGVVRLVNSTAALVPTTTGGLTTTSVHVLNNTTALDIKASPGQLYGIRSSNNGNTWAYIKLYNDTTATAGAGTPFDRVAVPPGVSSWHNPNGIAYGTGITAIVTTGIADADTTAPAASEYLISFDYK